MTAPLPGVPRGRLVACLAAVWVLWGSVYLGIRLVINEVDPFQAMGQRFLVAGLLLTVVVVVRRGPAGMRVSPSSTRSSIRSAARPSKSASAASAKRWPLPA